MRSAWQTIGARWWWPLAACLMLLLASCATNDPFGKDGGVPGPKGKPVPPIALAATRGMPASRVADFTTQLTDLGGQRDIAIVEGQFDDGTLSLTGAFTATPSSSIVVLSYSWTLTDKAGAVLHQFAGQEEGASAGGADAWSAITPAVLQRVAAKTIRSLADRLSELGYATQTTTLEPPGDAMMVASASDSKSVDYETLNGPGAVDPLETASVGGVPPESETSAMADLIAATSAEPESRT